MPRPERPLDASEGVLPQFAADLRLLRQKAGKPGYRELARRAHYAPATLSEAAAGRKLPTLAVTLAYVEACGGQRVDWEARWHTVAAELAGPCESGDPELADDRSAPYVGLAAFHAKDAPFFFGREHLLRDVRARLRDRRCLALFGASGSGKSSILLAGVAPGFTGPSVVLNPGPHPIDECAAKLARLAGVVPDLLTDPRTLHQAVLVALADQPPEVELLIVVDQFEEVFTLCVDQRERAAFITALLTAAQASNSRARVVLGVRADFYSRCSDYPELVEVLNDAQILVGAMTTQELRQAITQPAAKAGCSIEGALLAAVIAEAAGRRNVLPLVSHALLETWKRRHGAMLTLQGYQAAGGIQGALAQTAEARYSALSPGQQRLAKALLLRLIALGDGTEDTKRRIQRAELGDDPDTEAVLQQLASARLLTLDDGTVEITHEALIHAWPRLQGWLAEDRNGIRTHHQLTEAAAAWDEMGRDPGALYRGARLAIAVEWAADATMSPREQAFFDASRRAAQRSIHRRRLVTTLGAVLLVLALAMTFVATQQRQTALEQTKLARSREMVAKAATMASQPDAAMLLAIEAFRQAPTPEARGTLLSAQAMPFAGKLTGHTDVVESLDFSPDGRTLATAARDGTLKLWDVASRRETATFTSGPNDTPVVRYSADGKSLIATRSNATVAVWNTASREVIATLSTGPVNAMALSNDDRTVAVTSHGGRLSLFDVMSGSHAELGAGEVVQARWIAFHPDGRSLVSVDFNGPMRFWDVASRKETGRITPGAILDLAYSPDGRSIAAATGTGVKVWDLASGHEIFASAGISTKAMFTPDGRGLVLTDREGISLVSLSGQHKAVTLAQPGVGQFHLALSPDGRTLATVGEGRTVSLWEIASARTFRSGDGVHALNFGSDGHTVVTGGTNGKVTVWDTAARTPAVASSSHTDPVIWLASGPDGLVAMDLAGRVKIWDVASRQEITTFAARVELAAGITLSSDGRTLVTGNRSEGMTVWDVPSRRESGTVAAGAPVISLAFSPDNRTLAAGLIDGKVLLWDIVAGREIATLVGHTGPVRTVDFSPDGHTLLSGGADGPLNDPTLLNGVSADMTLKLWDIPMRKQTATIVTRTETLGAVAFSPDGRTVAATGRGKTIMLWDVAGRGHVATLTGHTDNVSDVAFSPDGRTLASIGIDDTLRLWDLDAQRVTDRLCAAIDGPTLRDLWAKAIPDLPYSPVC